MKVCPECQQQFGDEHDFCPHHGTKLILHRGVSSPHDATVMGAPAWVANEYDRLLGQVLDGRYYLEEKLGEGGMGVVFRARHTVIEKTVAIKILKREVARDRAVMQRFVQEAKSASRIGHAAIVEFTDFGFLPDESAYAVMEFIDGDTLQKVMKGGPMTASRALPIVAQIARALAAAHEKGIIHRDLKPDNIFLVQKQGRADLVKIVDFGIAKIMPVGANLDGPRLTRAGAVFGTPEYMAPEQAAGRSDNDHRVDIYALGTILYELLTGAVPHKGETVVATLAQQMLDPIIPPRRMNPQADISDQLEAVIMTALAKDRDKRYHTMGELWVALNSASGGIPLEPMGAAGSSRTTDPPPFTTPPGIPTFVPKEGTDRARRGRRHPTAQGSATVPDVNASARVEASIASRLAKQRTRKFLIAGGITVAIAAITSLAIAVVVMHKPGDDHSPAGTPDAGSGKVIAHGGADAGAGKIAVPAGGDKDAGTQVASGHPADAGTEIGQSGTPDGGSHVVINQKHKPDAGVNLVDTVLVNIHVSTVPAGGSLYVGGEPTMTDGVTIRRPRGTKMDIRCRIPGNDRWDVGHVSLVFDGRTTDKTCTIPRKRICEDELKSPYPCPN